MEGIRHRLFVAVDPTFEFLAQEIARSFKILRRALDKLQITTYLNQKLLRMMPLLRNPVN